MQENKLSVIIPFVQEWPQIVFTVRSIAEELKGQNFEIIVIDNFCPNEMKQQGISNPDRGGVMMEAVASKYEWLKVIKLDNKLSHWQSKNKAVSIASGNILFFSDSHCVPGRSSITNGFNFYKKNWKELNGTLHLPVTYQILENKKLIYKLVANKEKGDLRYSFTNYKEKVYPYEVPCMSTCGMFLHKTYYDKIGGWPELLGIYGGGENFINFVMSILGMKKFIMNGEPLYHHGDNRGYSWNYNDMSQNRAIANYMFGGIEWLDLYINNRKGDIKILKDIKMRVISQCFNQRTKIKSMQQISIEEWIEKWKDK